jgi:hypothetical protein
VIHIIRLPALACALAPGWEISGIKGTHNDLPGIMMKNHAENEFIQDV